jgi:hypothetical protein
VDREHGGIIYTYMYIQYIDYIYIHMFLQITFGIWPTNIIWVSEIGYTLKKTCLIARTGVSTHLSRAACDCQLTSAWLA